MSEEFSGLSLHTWDQLGQESHSTSSFPHGSNSCPRRLVDQHREDNVAQPLEARKYKCPPATVLKLNRFNQVLTVVVPFGQWRFITTADAKSLRCAFLSLSLPLPASAWHGIIGMAMRWSRPRLVSSSPS